MFEKKPTERDGYLPENLVRSLMRYSEICLSPTTNMLDDRNGIRQCANRLSPLFELDPDESEGHDAVAIYFHPYQNQVSSDKLKNNIWTHCSRILTTLRTRQTAPSELGFLFKSLSYRWSKLCRHVSCIVWECFHLFIRCLF